MNNINQFSERGYPVGYWDGEFDSVYYKGIFKQGRFTGYKKVISIGKTFAFHHYRYNNLLIGFSCWQEIATGEISTITLELI